MKDCSPGADEILLRQGGKWGYVRYHSDANGNVTFLLDNDGRVVEKYTYDVFGRPKIMGPGPDGEVRAASHYDNRFLFQGREYIGEVGVYDYRNRFYHPSLGRFLQKDPIGFDAGDMNLFRYCGDDPVDGSDPTGLKQDDPQPLSRPLISSGGGDWDWFNGRVGLDQMVQPQAGIIMAAVASDSEGPKSTKGFWNKLREHVKSPEFERVLEVTMPAGKGAGIFNKLFGRMFARGSIRYVDDVLRNPSLLKGKTPAEVTALARNAPGWRVETLGKGTHEGQGLILRQYTPSGNPTGRMIRWHPGGGHHGPKPYWRTTSGEHGVSEIIPGAP